MVGAAWVAPAITAVSAAPAFAGTGSPVARLGALTLAYADYQVTPANKVISGQVNLEVGPISVDTGTGVGTPLVLFSINAFVANTATRYAYFDGNPSGWSLSGNPTFANGKTTVTFAPISAGTVASGVTTYPSIVGAVRFRSTSETTVYVAPDGTAFTATISVAGATGSTVGAETEAGALSIATLSTSSDSAKGKSSYIVNVGPITNTGAHPATTAVTLKVVVPKLSSDTVTYRNVDGSLPLPTGWSNVTVANASATATITLTSTNTSLASGASVPGLSFLAYLGGGTPLPETVTATAEATACTAGSASATVA